MSCEKSFFIIIYGKDNCPHCVRAKEFAISKGLPFVYKTLGEGYTKEELKEKKLKASGAEFNVPLWISPNSQKFESVLNSIINNRTVKLSLPGGSSPVASQEGFTKREESPMKKHGTV